MRNWSSGILAQCWGMSLTQRDLFYKVRFDRDSRDGGATFSAQQILDAVTGKSSEIVHAEPQGWLTDTLAGRSVPNSELDAQDELATRIQQREKGQFFQPKNLNKIASSGQRFKWMNHWTLKRILSNLEKGRMPLVIVRSRLTLQHAVLIKDVIQPSGNSKSDQVFFRIYDSNRPWEDRVLEFYDGDFYAPMMFPGMWDDRKAVGVFISNERQMDELQDANYAYYQDLCEKAGK